VITTTYKCDRCGKESNDREQVWSLDVRMNTLDGSINFPSKMVSVLWCRECCERIGWLPPVELRAKKEEPKPPTIEDLLREIVSQEVAGYE
jgi:hypothetical protein